MEGEAGAGQDSALGGGADSVFAGISVEADAEGSFVERRSWATCPLRSFLSGQSGIFRRHILYPFK